MTRRINVIRTGVLLYLLSAIAACSPWGMNIADSEPDAIKTTPQPAPYKAPPKAAAPPKASPANPLPPQTCDGLPASECY